MKNYSNLFLPLLLLFFGYIVGVVGALVAFFYYISAFDEQKMYYSLAILSASFIITLLVAIAHYVRWSRKDPRIVVFESQ